MKKSDPLNSPFNSVKISVIKVSFLCFCMLCSILSGCTKESEAQSEKIVVTTLYISDFPQLEKLIETTFSDIDLQCEIMPYSSELNRRLVNGHGPDLVISKESNIAEYLHDISDLEASSAYDGTIMKELRVEGKNYQLPLPGQYYGYIINETMFMDAGIKIPENNEELIEALNLLKAEGIGLGDDTFNFSIQNEYSSDFGMYLISGMVPDFLGTMKGVQWLSAFKENKNEFADEWYDIFALTDTMIEEGVLDPAPITKKRNSVRNRERMGQGTLAAVFGNSSLYAQCLSENQKDVEEGKAEPYTYRMLPVMSDADNASWFVFTPSAYIGINASVSDKKLDACKRILELISTQQGQDAIIEDIKMGASCLRDYKHAGSYVPNGVEPYAESGYIYNVNFPSNIIDYLGRLSQDRIADKLTAEEMFAELYDYYFQGSAQIDYDISVIANLKQDLLLQNFNVRKGESEIGNFVADCVAEAADAPIAVVNGGSIRASLYAGDVYGSDLKDMLPFDNAVVVIETDGQTIWDMLENSISTCTDEFPSGRFLQVSGLSYVFDSSKPIGSRLLSVTLSNGTPLDLKKDYQLAVNNYMAGYVGYAEGNGDGFTMLNWYDESLPKGNVKLIKETKLTYQDAVKQYFNLHPVQEKMIELEGRILDKANG